MFKNQQRQGTGGVVLWDVVPLAGEDACGRRGRRPSEVTLFALSFPHQGEFSPCPIDNSGI
ncbi:MAG: hypothetical protein IJF84_08765 [Thermoguttaceae bacterium]|nr:hypothetical protein [Thermoguttaceae bacterium]